MTPPTPEATEKTAHSFLFPGQGVQRSGMGADLFDRHPGLVDQADRVLGYSVRTLCLDDPLGRLARTRYAQPAVYVVNALAYRELLAGGPEPDVLLGHSLGEYNALEAAGCFDFATGVRLVRARAEATCDLPGAMLAVVGLRRDVLAAVLRDRHLEGVVPANLNSTRQTVLSGPAREIEEARAALAAAGAKVVTRLAVTGPFHSPHMAPAIPRFTAELARTPLAPPRTTVVSNVTARPHTRAALRRRLAQHLVRPVLWQRSVEWVLDTCESRGQQVVFHEVGGNHLLDRLVEHIRRERTPGSGTTGTVNELTEKDAAWLSSP